MFVEQHAIGFSNAARDISVNFINDQSTISVLTRDRITSMMVMAALMACITDMYNYIYIYVACIRTISSQPNVVSIWRFSSYKARRRRMLYVILCDMWYIYFV